MSNTKEFIQKLKEHRFIESAPALALQNVIEDDDGSLLAMDKDDRIKILYTLDIPFRVINGTVYRTGIFCRELSPYLKGNYLLYCSTREEAKKLLDRIPGSAGKVITESTAPEGRIMYYYNDIPLIW